MVGKVQKTFFLPLYSVKTFQLGQLLRRDPMQIRFQAFTPEIACAPRVDNQQKGRAACQP